MKTKFDTKKIYCRKLGHHLTFKYCREENLGMPCAKILDCWYDKIHIHDYLGEFYVSDDLNYLYKSQTPKITSILNLIEDAKRRVTNKK